MEWKRGYFEGGRGMGEKERRGLEYGKSGVRSNLYRIERMETGIDELERNTRKDGKGHNGRS